MVVPAGLLAVPTVRTTGTALPEAAPAGTVALICKTPFTTPGASSATALAVTPPIVTVTFAVGLGGLVKLVGTPSAPGGVVTPSPVAKNVTIEPFAAGFAAPFGFPSWLTALI